MIKINERESLHFVLFLFLNLQQSKRIKIAKSGCTGLSVQLAMKVCCILRKQAQCPQPPLKFEIYVWCEEAFALFCHVFGILQLEEFSFHSFVCSFIVLYPTVDQF